MYLESHSTQSLKEIYGQIGQKPWGEVLVAINELLKITTLVRNASSYNNTKDFSGRSWDPDDWSFQRLCQVLVRRRFKLARSTLTNQLSDAIVQRRKRLTYRQRHERKIAGDLSDGAADSGNPGHSNGASNMSSDTLLQDTPAKKPTRPHSQQRHAASTLLSAPTPSQIYTPGRASTISASAMVTITYENEDLIYPHKPQLGSKDGSLSTCPYCAVPLPPNMSDPSWK